MSKEVIWSGSGEQPSGALCVRNIKSREGYDYWDKLCAIPRYGFIHSPDNSRVLKAEGVGNWIDQHAAQEVVDEAQSEVNQLRAENKALLAERDARLLQVDTLADWYSNSLDVIREITAALPGAHYMDPPDGGDVSIPEQVRRMAKDAERYRWLRMADWWNSPLCVIRDPKQQAKPGTDCPSRDRLDEAIDAALQGEQL